MTPEDPRFPCEVRVISRAVDGDRRNDFMKRSYDAGVVGCSWFSAIDGLVHPVPYWWSRKSSAGEWGRYQSHLSLVTSMITENQLASKKSDLLIFEDDCLFVDDFAGRFAELLAGVPENWGMVYLGGEHVLGPHRPSVLRGEPGILRTFGVLHHHAYLIRAAVLPGLYRHLNKYAVLVAQSRRLAFGEHMARFHHGPDVHVYAPREPLCGQAGGHSLTEGRYRGERWWQVREEYLREAS